MSYINKDKLIERMEAWRELWKEEEIDYIKSFPVSDVAPVVRGHWVHDAGGWKCSECGEKYIVQYIEDEKFCRNCGADMRTDSGEEESGGEE